MVLATHPNPTAPVLSHFSLSGKTALVTGGSRGIGLQVVIGLLEAGASVGFTYSSTSADELAQIVSSIHQIVGSDKTVKAYQCDVKDRESVITTVQAAVKDLGGLDIVVANSGIADHNRAEDYPEARYREVMDVNLNGVFWTAQAAANVMKGTKTRGSIIFTASVSGTLVNIPQAQSAYNASKAAVIHLAKSLAVEWCDFARVNAVSPGYVFSDMLDVHPKDWREKWYSLIPGGRFCEASELKGTYVYLASDASSYMTGANIIIDGGYTLP